jgi:hypothetical protein
MSARIITDRAARPTCLLQAVNRQLPSASSETCSADGTSISGATPTSLPCADMKPLGVRAVPSAVSGTTLANVRARAPRRRELCSSVDALLLPSQIGAAPDRARSALVGRPKRQRGLAESQEVVPSVVEIWGWRRSWVDGYTFAVGVDSAWSWLRRLVRSVSTRTASCARPR